MSETRAEPARITSIPWACPRCDKALDAVPDALRCNACNVSFPFIAGVPWLFSDPQSTLTEWRLRIDAYLAELARKSEVTRRALASDHNSRATRTRLEHLANGYEQQQAIVSELTKPLRPNDLGTPLAAHLALKTRLPPGQGVTSYHTNLHRDWCWGDDENRVSCEMVESALGGVPSGPLLVLGAGGGRLAYDLSVGRRDADVVALDINPLLMFVAHRVAAGESVEQVEFPLAPIDGEHSAVPRSLSAPRPSSRMQCVLADALRPPFAAGSFAAVVTPWLVDVIDEDLAVLAARINRLLRPGGRWVIFGSLAFDHPDPARQYGKEEVLHSIAAAGFDDVRDQEQVIPYMCSPASRHGRSERVVAIGATKSNDVEVPARHVALPDWLTQGTRPVPVLESFRLQAMTTRIYAFIMSMIDGKRSLRDMARLMEEQKLMPKREAEEAIRGFLIKMYDEAQRPPPN